ncbi:MAG: ketosteroid isomerase [Hymenobacter sp.]
MLASTPATFPPCWPLFTRRYAGPRRGRATTRRATHEVRAYWLRQWQELDPKVEPTGIRERADGRLEVAVHQVVHDLQGQVVFDGPVKHVYTLQEGLLKQMDIEPVSAGTEPA